MLTPVLGVSACGGPTYVKHNCLKLHIFPNNMSWFWAEHGLMNIFWQEHIDNMFILSPNDKKGSLCHFNDIFLELNTLLLDSEKRVVPLQIGLKLFFRYEIFLDNISKIKVNIHR